MEQLFLKTELLIFNNFQVSQVFSTMLPLYSILHSDFLSLCICSNDNDLLMYKYLSSKKSFIYHDFTLMLC